MCELKSSQSLSSLRECRSSPGVLGPLWPLWNLQVVYVDDLHIILVGKDKFLVLWMALAAYELVGTPFAYHKCRGGLEVEFAGYGLSYKHSCAGISPKRTS